MAVSLSRDLAVEDMIEFVMMRERQLEEDAEVKLIVDRYAAEFSAKMEEVVGETGVELDGRFASIRTSETNLGNFVRSSNFLRL